MTSAALSRRSEHVPSGRKYTGEIHNVARKEALRGLCGESVTCGESVRSATGAIKGRSYGRQGELCAVRLHELGCVLTQLS